MTKKKKAMKTTDISRAARAAAVMTASLLALACSDDDYGGGDMLSDSSSAGEGVYIACGIADIASSAITRADATEAGWTDAVWNENGIATLSVYIYSQQEEGSDGYALKYSGTTTSVNDGDKWKLYYSGGSALKPDDISATDSVFLIANYTVAEEEPDIEDLWADTFALGKTRGPQSSIVMSTRGIVDSLKSVSGDSLILGMTLERAIAKIALRIYYKRVGAESYEQLDSCVYDDGDSILFKLCNYAATGAVIDTPDSVSLQSEADYALSDTMYVEDGDARAVFYVCPNCWLDTTKVSSMNTEEPIDTLRQTHLMMMIKDTGHGQKYEYEYEIPVNYLLPEDNDAQEPDASYVDLYNIYRNHVYNVSIYVEEEDGGFIVSVGNDDDLWIEDLTDSGEDEGVSDGILDPDIEDWEETVDDEDENIIVDRTETN